MSYVCHSSCKCQCGLRSCGCWKFPNIELQDTLVGDPVKSPSHYIGKDGLEVKEIIYQFDLGFCTGGAVKYILRAGKKGDEVQDLKKAIEMLNIEIANLERSKS